MLPAKFECVLVASVALAPALAYSASRAAVYASSEGAHLDSDLLKGGGTDDTQALQAILDRANRGKPVDLIIDGPALVGGLNVYGNTIVECVNGGGLFLKDNASRAIIRNAHRSRDTVTDERITIRGCFLNGNRPHQPSADIPRPDFPYFGPSNKEADGTYLAGLEFLGVNDLDIEHVALWNVRAFGALIANGARITLRDVNIDHGGGPDAEVAAYVNTDGLHFKGPLRYLILDGIRVRVGDDAIALNADDYETDDLTRRNDFGPYVRAGPITDVTINNVQLLDTRNGFRLLSAKHRIDRVMISNVSGTVRGYHLMAISHWVNPTSLGNVGSILVSNVSVDRTELEAQPNDETEVSRKAWEEFRRDHPERWSLLEVESNDDRTPFFNINAHVAQLVLRNVLTTVGDDRPILRLGRDAKVRLLSADLHLLDPHQKAVPVKLDRGARVGSLTLSVDWERAVGTKARDPILSRGTIGELHLYEQSRCPP